MERANLFAENDIDLSGFTPAEPKPAPSKEQVKKVSEAASFRSREPAPPAPPLQKRPPRLHRTGRNVQFNVKASQEAIDAFYRISDEQGWVLGETFERSIAALEQVFKK